MAEEPTKQVFTFRKKKNNSAASFIREDHSRSESVDSFESHELSSSTFNITATEKKAFNFSALLNVNLKNTYKSMLSQQQETEEQNTDTQDKEEDFILARLEQHSRQQSAKSDKPSSNWFKELSTSFQSAKSNFLGSHAEEENEVDWEFWGKVINDYETMIRLYPKQFQKNMRKGLPEPIRGMMWQLMSDSKSESLEEEYLALLTRNSRHEKIIQRDLARTFPGHEYFKDPEGPGQTSLFNILKGISI
jgi:hypothetical protein